MKAIILAQYGGPEQLSLQEVARPKAGSGQVLVRVVATSLNPIDLKRASGIMREIFPVEFPFIPGADFSGVVEELGEGAGGFHVGDEVFGVSEDGGTYAEYLTIDASRIGIKPARLKHAEAASLALVAQTAAQALESAGVKAGETVLILAAGGAVGEAAVQLAHAAGARILTVSYAESIGRLHSYGADETIDSRKTAFESVAKDVDAVIDGLGGEWQQRSFGVLKPGGILVALNQPPSADEAARHHVRAMMLQTQGSTAQLDALSAKIEAGKLKPFIGRTYALKDVPQAWMDSRSSHIEGKIVFQVAAEK